MAGQGSYTLESRYTADRGTVFLSGNQALARLPIDQLRADRRAGSVTAALVTGYPGSPLAGFDSAVASAARLAPDLPIVCRPALNEEYAATAVMGSQLVANQPDRRYDGVVGIWYGKAPGVDRASDALRHAVFAGTDPRGGAIALVGDDPGAKSSTIPSSAAGVLADLHMPLLYPGDPGEALDLGRHAVAISRLTGLWGAVKMVADVADGTASVELDPDRIVPILPSLDAHPPRRQPEGRLLTPLTLELERDIYEVRYPLSMAYASLNSLNYVSVDPPDAWIGIITSGITYRELRQALALIGLGTDDAVRAAGIRLLRMRMPLPFDPATVRSFARGLDEVLVVEEKSPNIESLVKDALYAIPDRPRVVGKLDEHDRPLVPGFGALDADAIVSRLRARLSPRVGDRLAPAPPPPRPRIALSIERSPYYCSGCPHNRSTESPDGVLVGGGIGCHTMALLMDPTRFGDIAGVTCMGNEGTQWIGMADFLERDHFVQNIGDGTYFHSGQLAVAAAVASGTNITYKLLYNGAIAMTGGQHPQGQQGVAELCDTLLARGVRRVIVTADDVERARAYGLPGSVEVWPRERLLEAQAELAKVPGVTVLVHDQACAAETRRLRRRGRLPTPTQRVVINDRICEGCGDCGQVSNCLSVQPHDTAFGRKTQIDQTTCNLDYSCIEGDCPSFMTIETAPRRWRRRSAPPTATSRTNDSLDLVDLPDPVMAVPTDDFSMRITGIGGTGVVTVAQVLGTAAMLDGYQVRGLDQIGLSQKAGPVVSDLRLSRSQSPYIGRLATGQADLLLALDQLVAGSERGLRTASPENTVAVGSTSGTPTGAMIAHPELAMPTGVDLSARIAEHTRADDNVWADAEAITTAAFGDATTANTFVVGMAVQAGTLPIAPARIEEAISLNGVAVDANLAAFRLGRRHVVSSTTDAHNPPATTAPTIDEIVALRSKDLVDYQGRSYARGFDDFIAQVVVAEESASPGSRRLSTAVAINLHKLMAYKDEYEVARLMFDADALGEARRIGGRISYRLHPPMLRALGVDRKISFGPWTMPLFRVLARGRRLRGTVFDPFRWAEVRRLERALPGEYRAAVEVVLGSLSADGLDAAVALAELPDLVRGYEHLKLRRIADYRDRLARSVAKVRLET